MVERTLDAVEREELKALTKRIGWNWLETAARSGLTMTQIIAVHNGKRVFDVSRLAYFRRVAMAIEAAPLRTLEDDMDEPTMAERLKAPVEIGRAAIEVPAAQCEMPPSLAAAPVADPMSMIVNTLADLYVEQMDHIEGDRRDGTEDAYSRVAERLGIEDMVAHAIRQRLPKPLPIPADVMEIGPVTRIAGAASLPPG